MKICLTSALFLLGMLITPVWAKTATPASPHQAIQAAYAKMDRVTDSRDAKAYTAFLGHSFIHYEPDGSKMDRATWVFLWKGTPSDFRWSHTKTKIISITPQGNGLIVVRHTVAMLPDDDIDGSKITNATVYETDRDYWMMKDGKWKILQERRLPDSDSNGTQADHDDSSGHK